MIPAPSDPPDASGPWLIRIARVFAPLLPEILAGCGGTVTTLTAEYHLLAGTTAARLADPRWSRFIRWRLPLHHTWPCQPRLTAGFVEKAAAALQRKFAPAHPQALLCGPLDPGSPDPHYRRLAANLRGRALQLMPPATATTADDQAPTEPTLFCLLGKQGLFVGMAAPRDCGGFHPGGTRFIRQDENTISRAGAKIAEALHLLCLHRPPPSPGSHWLELGACPGGMTAELLVRNQRVTAIDRAPLDPRLDGAAGLNFILSDVTRFQPPAGAVYDALLCDLNGSPREAMSQVARLAPALVPGGLVVFTLKTTGADTLEAIRRLAEDTAARAAAAGLRLLAETHLTYNRHEFTWLLGKML